ncbi:MAG TPA: glucose-6-phosphate dehydrogenase [Candidatus Dormibacteraeota bacterium]|nr:glucose-6-phosphate dehydrogenase [Candidatus Dormibacteraeota bacterium]
MTLCRSDAQDIVVVGITGDLAARKLLPALYNLEAEDLLPERGRVIGYATERWSVDDLREHARQAIAAHSRTGLDDAVFARFAQRLDYVGSADGMEALAARLTEDSCVVYLAVPSSAFIPLVGELDRSGIARRAVVIIEKPFGHNVESARALNDALHAVLPEERIFRIDHYMGKETVQNLLVFRFGNAVFERVWNRDCITQVEIGVAESLGVEQRGAFYEETGAIRDIVQNHLFQVLSITAMEPPVSFDAEALRNEKVKVLTACHPVDPGQVVRGQYTAGEVDGVPVRGYREEPGVSPGSTTETYAALRLRIDSWRWAGVPFLLRTGKRLRARETRVTIAFKDVPLHLFSGSGGPHAVHSNHLVIRIQPDEGISFSFIAKQPGPDIRTQKVHMDFAYGRSFKVSPPEAYERLLHDVLHRDHTLFIREDEVERGWEIVDPVIRQPGPVHPYPAGSWGPSQANALAGNGHWHSMEDDDPAAPDRVVSVAVAESAPR